MRKMKQIFGGLLYCVAEAVVGILLLIDPISFTSGIIVALGAVFALLGIGNVIRYFGTPVEEAAKGQMLTVGLLLLTMGLFAVLRSEWIILTLPLLTVFYGMVLFVTGIRRIQFVADTIRRKEERWIWGVISAVAALAGAVVILWNPFASTATLWMFTGISVIVDAVLDFLAVAFIRIPVEKASVQEEAKETAPPKKENSMPPLEIAQSEKEEDVVDALDWEEIPEEQESAIQEQKEEIFNEV